MTVNDVLVNTHLVFRKANTTIATYVSILSGLGWGIGLLVPGETLARPTYRFMHHVGTDIEWGVWFIAIAICQMIRLYCKTEKSSVFQKYFDVSIRFLAMVTWIYVAAACLASQWPIAVAMFDTMIVAMFAFWDFVRFDTYSNEIRISRNRRRTE